MIIQKPLKKFIAESCNDRMTLLMLSLLLMFSVNVAIIGVVGKVYIINDKK